MLAEDYQSVITKIRFANYTLKVQDQSLYHLDNLHVDVCHVLHFHGPYSKTNKAPTGDTDRKILALPQERIRMGD